MAPHFLHDFPREIRDQVYIHTLSSPTGYMILFPCTSYYNSNNNENPCGYWRIIPCPGIDILPRHLKEAIDLSLLRTCTQIYEECKNVCWEQNGWAVYGPSHLLYGYRGLDRKLSLRVRRVQMDIDVTNALTVNKTSNALRVLGRWSQEGNLMEVTLTLLLKERWLTGIYAVNTLLRVRKYSLPRSRANPQPRMVFQEYLTVLAKAGGEGGHLSRIKRSIEFDAEWEIDCSIENPLPVIEDMHFAFGGEFLMDGKLVFKDGVEIYNYLREDLLEFG